ncbi:recombinase family protein [Labrys miyagiensis]|uniref:recombinase family protein n=1 Tax=Labrys miyagiensis TaxID=346912 RepID=UPI0032AFD763
MQGRGTEARLLGSYVEIESGKRSDRPQLLQAIRKAKLTKSRLLIGKIDRLSRNVHFLSGLMESGVHFTAVDMPDAIVCTNPDQESCNIQAHMCMEGCK